MGWKKPQQVTWITSNVYATGSHSLGNQCVCVWFPLSGEPMCSDWLVYHSLDLLGSFPISLMYKTAKLFFALWLYCATPAPTTKNNKFFLVLLFIYAQVKALFCFLATSPLVLYMRPKRGLSPVCHFARSPFVKVLGLNAQMCSHMHPADCMTSPMKVSSDPLNLIYNRRELLCHNKEEEEVYLSAVFSTTGSNKSRRLVLKGLG